MKFDKKRSSSTIDLYESKLRYVKCFTLNIRIFFYCTKLREYVKFVFHIATKQWNLNFILSSIRAIVSSSTIHLVRKCVHGWCGARMWPRNSSWEKWKWRNRLFLVLSKRREAASTEPRPSRMQLSRTINPDRDSRYSTGQKVDSCFEPPSRTRFDPACPLEKRESTDCRSIKNKLKERVKKRRARALRLRIARPIRFW